MSEPLFTKKELVAHEAALTAHEKEHNRTKSDWGTYWAERENLVKAHQLVGIKRAQARAREYLDGLLVLVGSRGQEYLRFEHAFASSDDPKIKKKIAECNTPEARRTLYTILKALTEIPHSWATSAFTRFLRGNGKQRGAKFHGAGLLAVEYGWKGNEVEAICKPITSDRDPYSRVLMSYVDLTEVEREVKEKEPDYEVGTDLRFAACARRDKEFLQKLCGMLEAEGLADIAAPVLKEPPGPHVPKVFKAGDIIRRKDLRDLPLPAHVRIPVERLPTGMSWSDSKPGDWTMSTIDQVVQHIGNQGNYTFASIGNDPNTAHIESFNWKDKSWLDGATYVGPWKGKKVTAPLKINFVFRLPEKKKK